jgi:hypothetical protein
MPTIRKGSGIAIFPSFTSAVFFPLFKSFAGSPAGTMFTQQQIIINHPVFIFLYLSS